MARLDTGWHVNPKVLQVGLMGMGLHAWSISYCDHARSDGFIPAGAWPALPGAGAAVKSLLVVGLWERTDGGFRLHDYTDYNRTRAEIETREANVRERQSRHRSRVTDTVTEPVTNGVTLARAADPVPVPVSRIKRDTPDPPTPLPDADAQGAPPTASARGSPEPPELAVIHATAGICPLCRKPYLGAYLDHTEAEHAVRSIPAPGNLGPALGRRRRRSRTSSTAAPPPEVEAQFAAMHDRLQSMPGAEA